MREPDVSAPPEWLDDLKVLTLRDGDIVVVRCQRLLSDVAAHHLKEKVTEVIESVMAERGIRFKVMVFEEGMDIGVLRGESDA